jgi:hypothetical protein
MTAVTRFWPFALAFLRDFRVRQAFLEARDLRCWVVGCFTGNVGVSLDGYVFFAAFGAFEARDIVVFDVDDGLVSAVTDDVEG